MKQLLLYQPAPAGGGGVPAASTPALLRMNGSAAHGRNILAVSGVVIKELYRRKDFYVLFVLTALLTLLLGSLNFFNETGIVRYVKEICLLLIWISSLVVVITTASRQIPSEREQRTIFPLLAKPVTRSDVLLGKFLGCWTAGGIALLLFYVFFGVLSGAREHHWPVVNYFQAAVLHWTMLGIVVALTMLGSLFLAAPSSTNTIVFVLVAAMLLVGRHLNQVALTLSEPGQTIVYALYFALPHLEIYDLRDLLIHNWEPVPWAIWLGGIAYGLVYTGFFLALACVLFRRKRLN